MPLSFASTGGAVARFGTRERPHILLDDAGAPVALTTSVQHCQDPDVPDTCVGDEKGCMHGKRTLCDDYWPGYHDRSFTTVTPLRTSAT